MKDMRQWLLGLLGITILGCGGDLVVAGVDTGAHPPPDKGTDTNDSGKLVLNANCPVYVKTNGAAVNDGRSWATAKKSITDALWQASKYVALEKNTYCEVWVATGVYKPTEEADQSASFELTSNVHLYGGFRGIETDISQRNLAENTTELNGDLYDNDGNDLSMLTNDDMAWADNSYQILTVWLATNVVIDGFTVSQGNGEKKGSGLLVSNSDVLLRNTSFRYCRSQVLLDNTGYLSGIIASEHSNLLMDNCTVEAVQPDTDLLGERFMIVAAHKTLEIRNSKIYGGRYIQAIDVKFADMKLYNSVFENAEIYQDSNTGRIDRCVFRQTTGSAHGLRLSSGFYNIQITNSLFLQDAGFMRVIPFINSVSAGNEFYISNCTFVDEFSTEDYLLQPFVTSPIQGYISNSIFFYRADPSKAKPLRNMTVENSFITGGCALGENTTCFQGNLGHQKEHVLNFVNPAEHDYRLSIGSAAIDAGRDDKAGDGNLLDLDGNERIQSAAVDMGAYEFAQ